MTRLAVTTAYSMANTAGLRITGASMNADLAAVGLVQTADTGQIDWTTVTLPGANALIGYEIWRFADSSIYFRLEWRANAANTNPPVFKLTVGDGSDGAGNITGTTIFPLTTIRPNWVQGATNLPSYYCHTADCFWMVFGHIPTATTGVPCVCSFMIEKIVDTTGADSGEGYVVTANPNAANSYAEKRTVRTAATATLFAASPSFCHVPGNVTTSLVGVDRQVWLHSYPTPRSRFSPNSCTVVTAELPVATTFAATLLGGTSKEYIALGNCFGLPNLGSVAYTWGTALLWEA